MATKRISLPKALGWIIGSALVINGSAFYLLRPLSHWRKKPQDLTAFITAIVQTGPEKQALNSDYLAEILDLSYDYPTAVGAFNSRQAEKKLLASPVIESAKVELVFPGIVYIDYTVRKPVALLSDFENMAIDERGVAFPFSPFFTPKNLPEIYLGLKEFSGWNIPLKGEKIDLAFELLEILDAPVVCDLFNIKKIDVSRAFDPSFGKREAVLLAEDRLDGCRYPRFLRLSTKGYRQELANYLKLRETLIEKERRQLGESSIQSGKMPCKVIDFRIPQLAFIDEKEE